MERYGRGRLLSAGVLVLAIGLAPLTTAAEQLTWDQAKVSELAEQLAKAVADVRKAAKKEPSLGQGSQPNRRAAAVYLDTLKALEQSTKQLARKLAAGEGHDETLATARKIGTLLRDVREEGKKLRIPEGTQAKIEPAGALIDQIRPYYAPPPEGE